MKILVDQWSWNEYVMDLDKQGIAGASYPFEHMNEPDVFPCGVHTLVNEYVPVGKNIQLVHVFFNISDAYELIDIDKKMSDVRVREEGKDEKTA